MINNHSVRFIPLILITALLFSASCQGEAEVDNGEGDDGGNMADNGRVIWEREIGITGLFRGVEPCYKDGRIYVVSLGEGIAEWDRFIENPPKDVMEGVYCLNADSGEVLWHTDIGEDPFSDVVLFNESIYLYSPDSLLRLNIENGEVEWAYPLSNHIYAESPAVSPDAVFCVDNDRILAVRHNSQDVIWEATVPVRARSLFYNDGYLYIGAEGKWEEVPAYLFCLDTKDGSEVWRYAASDFHEIVDEPIIVDGCLYLHSSEGRVHCLDVASGERIWIQDFAEWNEEDQCNYVNPMTSSPNIVNDRLYIGRSMDPGFVYCVDTITGDIVWKTKRYPEEPDARVTTSIAYSDGKLYYGWGGWKVETEGGHRSASFLSCISAEDGAPIWDFELDDRVATTPLVTNDKVYFGSSNGFFYCLDTSGP